MIVCRAKLSKRFQITVPAEVRRQLGIAPGDEVQLAMENGNVILRATKGTWTERFWGLGADMWRQAGGGKAVIEEERKSWDEQPARRTRARARRGGSRPSLPARR